MQSINTLMSAFGVAPPDLSKLNKTTGKIKNDFEKEKFCNKGVSRLYVSPANKKK